MKPCGQPSSDDQGTLVGETAGMPIEVRSDDGGESPPAPRLVQRQVHDFLLTSELPLRALAGFFILRFFLTMVSSGSGAPAGIFAPLLVLGAATTFPRVDSRPVIRSLRRVTRSRSSWDRKRLLRGRCCVKESERSMSRLRTSPVDVPSCLRARWAPDHTEQEAVIGIDRTLSFT